MESYRIINKVPTKLLTFGKGVGDDLLDVKHLIVVFPGNPGIIDCYREFMKKVYTNLKAKYPKHDIPVWGISHAGHQTEGLHEFTFPHINENPELYSLEGQYAHKVRFLQSFVPPHINVIGVGHSIGCKIWMETMKRLDDTSQTTIAEPKKGPTVSKLFMLFPTIERMRHTPNGESTWPLINYHKYLLPLIRPLAFLPTFIHKWILSLNFRGRTVPESVFQGSMQLFNYDIVRRVAYLAQCELEEVVELDEPAIETYLKKLYFYFGTKDGWCPLTFADGMRDKFPQLECKICENGYEHAFVIESSVGMANFLCDQFTFSEIQKDEVSNENVPVQHG